MIKTLTGTTYNVLFGWLDKRTARQNQTKFELEIRQGMPCLFSKGRGWVIPNKGVPYPPGFDSGFVTVSLENFLLRFVRGRGELGVKE